MKNFFLLIACLASLQIFAQDDKSTAGASGQTRMIEFNGGNYTGTVTDVDAPTDMIENAIKQYFFGQGVKPKEINGFMVFRNVKLDASSSDLMDVFAKVERKSRKEKESSTVSFIAAKAGEISDLKQKSGTPTSVITSSVVSGALLGSLSGSFSDQAYQKALLDKQEEIKKAEKKLKSLKDDQESLENKIKKLQDDLKDNQKDQKTQSDQLEALRAELANMTQKKSGQ